MSVHRVSYLEHTCGSLWIVKPFSSSRGRGIFIVNDVRQIPPQYKAVACRYIANPLLLDRKAVRLTDSLTRRQHCCGTGRYC